MAKMFYSFEEVQEKLGRSGDQINQLVKLGKLREFRDGAKIMFKVADVDNLDLSGETDTGEIRLSPEDSADKMGLAGSGSSAEIELAPTDSADHISLDDTGEAAKKDDTVITTHGVNVFEDSDELEPVDPLAQTQIAPDIADQVALDGGSSGSGLLDPTREADDTSFGAELLEQIYPDSEEGAVETQLPTQMEVPTDAASLAEMESRQPTLADYTRLREVYDHTSGAFGAMLVVPLLMLIYLAFVAAAGIADVRPNLLNSIGAIMWPWGVGAALLATLAVVVIGYMLAGKTSPTAKPKPKPQ